MNNMSQNKQKFNCLGAACPNHCCGAYTGISPNLQTTGSTLFSEIVLLPEDVSRIQEAGYEHLIVHKNDKLSCIKTAPDGTCAALSNGRCAIYDYRPSICRAYPLYLDMYTGVCLLKECPGVSEDISIADFSYNLNYLLNIYQYWINFYRK